MKLFVLTLFLTAWFSTGGIQADASSASSKFSGDHSSATACELQYPKSSPLVPGAVQPTTGVQGETSDLSGTKAPGHDDVIFPGFNPEEQLLVQAMIHVSYMADQLDLAAAGEIDAATASERIEAARNALRETRAGWREAGEEERIRARGRQRADLERFEARLLQAIAAYAASEYRDYGLIQRLRTPPDIADFLREPPVETFTGVYRSGFEASDFYPLEGGSGPWWLTATGENWAELQSYLVRRPGRGSSVTVALTVTGWRETGGEYGGHGGYEASIYVESIEAIRAITAEEFDLIVNREP